MNADTKEEINKDTKGSENEKIEKKQVIQNKIKKLDEINDVINNYNFQIKQFKNEQHEIYKFLWKNCDHEWEIDNSEYDPITKKYCKKCTLWNCKYLYL